MNARPRRFHPALESLEGRVTPALVIKPTLVPPQVLTTTETGGTAIFTVALSQRPTRAVTYFLKSDDVTEGTVDKASVTFTPLNFNRPQVVKVTGRDDRLLDFFATYHVLLSTSPRFAGRPAATVTVLNKDTGVHGGIVVTPTTPRVTTEAGGTAVFTVRLTAKPTADVVIPLSSTRPTEGLPKNADHQVITRLVFTPANWDKPQTVTVQGVDDAVVDGDQHYAIQTGPAVSTDPAYRNRNAEDVALVNTDNDTAATLRAFDGSYTGTFTGTAATMFGDFPISGAFTFTLSNGVITLTAPVSGTGTLQLNGDSSFTISTEVIPSLALTGKLTKGEAGAITGTGTFTGSADTPFGPATATGTWTVSRVS